MTSKQNQSITTAAFYHFLPESAQVETVLNVLRFSQLLIRPIPNPGHRSHYVRKRNLKSVPTFGQVLHLAQLGLLRHMPELRRVAHLGRGKGGNANPIDKTIP